MIDPEKLEEELRHFAGFTRGDALFVAEMLTEWPGLGPDHEVTMLVRATFGDIADALRERWRKAPPEERPG